MASPSADIQDRMALRSPRHWLSWLAMALGWLASQLPYRLQMALGRRLGDIAYYVVPKRRRVADVNLRQCFPDLDRRARDKLLRAHFRSVGMGAIETGICWWAPQDKIERLAHIEGEQYLEQAALRGRGIILLSAHFTSLELGVRMAQGYLRDLNYDTTAMYKPPHDPVIDHVMRTRRERHIGGRSIPDNDVKSLLKALKRGDAVWYAGDQKGDRRLSVIVDFFGQPARTHVAISRLARLSRATVVPFFTLRRDDGRGYRLIVKPPLNDFPSGDDTADALRINRIIEAVIADAPAQYFWLHQRFKRTGHNPYKDAARSDA